MLIIRRKSINVIAHFLKGYTLLSGQRIIKKDIIRNVFLSHQPNGYQIELAINATCINLDAKVGFIDLNLKHIHK